MKPREPRRGTSRPSFALQRVCCRCESSQSPHTRHQLSFWKPLVAQFLAAPDSTLPSLAPSCMLPVLQVLPRICSEAGGRLCGLGGRMQPGSLPALATAALPGRFNASGQCQRQPSRPAPPPSPSSLMAAGTQPLPEYSSRTNPSELQSSQRKAQELCLDQRCVWGVVSGHQGNLSLSSRTSLTWVQLTFDPRASVALH